MGEIIICEHNNFKKDLIEEAPESCVKISIQVLIVL